MKEPKVVITNIEISKCLSSIKHINGNLNLIAPRASRAIRYIEPISGTEVFTICDELVDTIYFPKLRIIDTVSEPTISPRCNFFNVLYLPNIETMGSFSINKRFSAEARSGTIMGFDKPLVTHG